MAPWRTPANEIFIIDAIHDYVGLLKLLADRHIGTVKPCTARKSIFTGLNPRSTSMNNLLLAHAGKNLLAFLAYWKRHGHIGTIRPDACHC